MIYFVESAGKVKIGYTGNVKNRVATLATACPFKCTLIGVVEGTFGDEKAIHRRFVQFHSHGEWFHFSPEINSYLAAHAIPFEAGGYKKRNGAGIPALVEWRNENGVTQAELAKGLGVTRWMINRIETGERNPSLALAIRIGDFTRGGVTPNDISCAAVHQPKLQGAGI